MANVGPTTPHLFEVHARPTTRGVADRVKAHGLGGLPDAVRRGDAALYQEVVCRTALNRVAGMPFGWTLNPYRGCTHGCHYCFARRYQTQLKMGPGDDFSSVILVKVNFPEVLAAELARPSWSNDLVGLGTATDPYQPIEGRYQLTRKALEVLVRHPTPVGLITKGPLAVRDTDLLVELSRRTRYTVSFSVPTVDEEAWRQLEPGTAHPLQRLQAVERLARAGVDAGVLMAPIVPGISSHPAKRERTVRAIADHGAAYMGTMLMHLEGGTRDHFLDFVSREYPHLVEGYGRLYATKYAAKDYAERFRSVMGVLKARFGVTLASRAAHADEAQSKPVGPRPRPGRQPRLRFEPASRSSAGGARSAAVSADGC